jgi:tetratricopeptide (TPR) repeat protein
MAKKNETNKEEMEQLTATESFFDKYKKFIFIGAGAIVVIIIGFVAYQKFVTEPHIEESQDAYWNAFYEWEGNDTTDLAYTGNEYFSGFEEISSDYDGTPAGEIGNYAMATKAMQDGNFEEAIDYLDEADFDDIMVGTMVLGLKGDCYVELGDYDTALEQYEEAIEREPNEFTTPMFLMKAGLVYEELGDLEAAVNSYQRIKDEWAESTQAADIDKYIVRAQN